MLGFDPGPIIQLLTSKAGLLQVGAVATAATLAWLVSRGFQRTLPDQMSPGLAKIGAGSANRLVLPLAMLLFTWLARLALAKVQPVPLLNVIIPLVFAFAVIRLAVYLLRHSMAPSALLKSSERFIVLCVWGLFALHVTGVLGEIAGSLEEVSLPIGAKKITLLLVIQGVLSVIVTLFIALGVSGLLESRIMKADALNISSRVVISKLLRVSALTLAVLIALPLVGIDLTILSIFGGALGVGLGFGLQKIASNYLSGFIILLDRSIRLGDLVTIDGKHGVVEAIKSRYTVVKSLDGTQSIIPNDTLITHTVVNHSYADPKVAVKTAVTIGHDADLPLARALMLAAAASNTRVLAEPPPITLVKSLADNGIELELSVWMNDPDHPQAALRSELLVAVWNAFRENSIVVSLPQRETRPTPVSGQITGTK